MIRLLDNAAVLAASLTSLLPRALPRRRAPRPVAAAVRGPRRRPPYAAAALALGLGFNGIGSCLCAAEPLKIPDPHSCCPRSVGHDECAKTSTTGTAVRALSASCRASQTAPGFAARIDDRDVVRHALIAASTTYASPEPQIFLSAIAVSSSSLHFPSPPRTAVLRI